MNTSESINELATALCKAQGLMRAAEKDGNNPHFGKAYTTLAAVWDVVRDPLSSNGLSVIQPVQFGEHGGVLITTRLMHTSGQFCESSLLMPLEKQTAQGVGSAITYGRRYGLAAMVGVVSDEDDDGNAAEANAPKRQQASKPSAKKPDPTLELTEPEKLVVAEIRDLLKPLKSMEEYDELILTVKKKSAAVQLAVSPDCLKRKGELLAQGAAA